MMAFLPSNTDPFEGVLYVNVLWEHVHANSVSIRLGEEEYAFGGPDEDNKVRTITREDDNHKTSYAFMIQQIGSAPISSDEVNLQFEITAEDNNKLGQNVVHFVPSEGLNQTIVVDQDISVYHTLLLKGRLF